MIPSRFGRQWGWFRDRSAINTQQFHNLGVLIGIYVRTGRLKEGEQQIIIVTPPPKFAVYCFMKDGIVHIVGGHWLRHGEPTADWLKLIRSEIATIKAAKGNLQ